jgi:ferredoxin
MSTGLETDLPPLESADDDDDDEEVGWKEGLFVRDLEGRLIRYDEPTREQLNKMVKLTIDGVEIEVHKAVPATDEMGNPRYINGMVQPRATTIYDAVSKLYEKLDAENKAKSNGSGTAGVPENVEGAHPVSPAQPTADLPARAEVTRGAEDYKRMTGDLGNPIPILCHMKYMSPVAVCRVCVVEVGRLRRSTGKFQVDEKLLPACQHRVEEGMIVNSIGSPQPESRLRIEKAVKSLLSLLLADHPTPCAKEKLTTGDCEFEALAKRFGVAKSAFDGRQSKLPTDNSSLAIAVDHNACILCDRCIRGCDVIKQNNVLGRMGKGFEAKIAFDLGVSMGGSTCVACGECMVSCPTGALTFKDAIAADWFKEEIPGRSPKRRWSWVDWLTFGMFRHPTRFLKRTQVISSSSDEWAAR